MSTASAVWPIWDLVIRTPRLELTAVREADALELIDLAGRGIHDAASMPFLFPFTDLPSPQRERSSLQFYLGNWANWSVEQWRLAFIARHDGRPIGTQDVAATSFPVCRTVSSGSWVGAEHQGAGFGTEMRAGMLEFVFTVLDAHRAETDAFEDNEASLAVTRRLGYEPNGWDWQPRRGERARVLRFGLDRDRWRCPLDVVVEGAGDPLRQQFGI